MVVENRLRMEWSYSENIHRRETIEGLAQAYLQALQQLIDHCLSTDSQPDEIAYVDGDVNQNDLEAILAELNQTAGEE